MNMSETETHRLASLQPLSLFISVCPLLTEGVTPRPSQRKPQSHPQRVLLLHLPSSPAAVSGPSQSHADVRSGCLRLALSPPSLRCLCLGSDASRSSGQFQQLPVYPSRLSLPPPGLRGLCDLPFSSRDHSPTQKVSGRLTARLAIPISPLTPATGFCALLLPFPGVLRTPS